MNSIMVGDDLYYLTQNANGMFVGAMRQRANDNGTLAVVTFARPLMRANDLTDAIKAGHA